MLALVVRFNVLDGHLDAFDALVRDTIGAICAHEPDTVVYVSHAREDHPTERVFYECYRDTDAFAAHQASPHTERFMAEREAHLVEPPEVWRLTTMSATVASALIGDSDAHP